MLCPWIQAFRAQRSPYQPTVQASPPAGTDKPLSVHIPRGGCMVVPLPAHSFAIVKPCG